MTTTHAFDTAIRLADNGIGQYIGQTTPEYANMVGPFGGVTAAAILGRSKTTRTGSVNPSR